MKNVLLFRTKAFAHNCVKLSLQFPQTYLGNHIKGQLIRSSTSVAANYRATCIAQTKKGFVSKLSIVIEEVDEAAFWLEFVMDENLLPVNLCSNLHKEASELTAIFVATRKTAIANAIKDNNK
jgi:four helix bundle protein